MDGNKEQKSDGSPSVASLIPSGCKPKEKEMISGCCVCSEENGWTDNPLIYCDGPNCDVAVHQGNYILYFYKVIIFSRMLWNH